jgi:hypothetical protein
VKKPVVILCLFCLGAGSACAQLPASYSDIPVIAGASLRDGQAWKSKDYRQLDPVNGPSPGKTAEDEAAFNVPQFPEDVFAWYLKRLGSAESIELFSYDMTYYDRGARIEASEPPLKARREPFLDSGWKGMARHPQGAWIRKAVFQWRATTPDGGFTSFAVQINDDSEQDMRAASIVRMSYESRVSAEKEAEIRKNADREQDRDQMENAIGSETMKNRDKAAGAPTQELLGVPLYPGAAYKSEMSQNMTAGSGVPTYVWSSADAAPAVVTFYEKATGMKAKPAGAAFVITAAPGSGAGGKTGLTIVIMKAGGATLITMKKK